MFAVTVSEVALAHTVITDGLSFHATRCEMVMTLRLYNASFAESFFFRGGGVLWGPRRCSSSESLNFDYICE